jgi:hypothetical protein
MKKRGPRCASGAAVRAAGGGEPAALRHRIIEAL